MIENLHHAPSAYFVFMITIITSLYALYSKPYLIYTFSLSPYEISRGRKIHTLLTSGLVHANLQHLLFNMLSFYFFAFDLEKKIGHFNFLIIYLTGLVLSDISTIIKKRNNQSYQSLGASGAISAVLFSYIIFDPFSKLILFPIPFPIPAYFFALGYLIYCVWASRNQKDHINHEAHFWGAISGILITALLFPSVFRFFAERILG